MELNIQMVPFDLDIKFFDHIKHKVFPVNYEILADIQILGL